MRAFTVSCHILVPYIVSTAGKVVASIKSFLISFFFFLRTQKTVENEPPSHRALEACCAIRKMACENITRDNVDLFDCPTSTFPPHRLGHLADR